MKKFENITAIVAGTFPTTKAVASSTPTTPDGTPYLKALLDEYWGWMQALLNDANITPSGTTEIAGASDILNAIKNVAGFPGEVVGWMASVASGYEATATYGIRLIRLAGQGILRADYSKLDEVTYVGDVLNGTAEAFYHADHPSGTPRNIAGDYLILPNTRGYFLRGLDPSGTIDPDGVGRKVGDKQLSSLHTHSHHLRPILTLANRVGVETLTVGVGSISRDILTIVPPASPLEEVYAWEDIPGGVANPDETRPVNVTTQWYIRY